MPDYEYEGLQLDKGQVAKDLIDLRNLHKGYTVGLTSFEVGKKDFLQGMGIPDSADQILLSNPETTSKPGNTRDLVNLAPHKAIIPFDQGTLFHVKAGIVKDPSGVPLRGFVGSSNITPSAYGRQINIAYGISSKPVLNQLNYALQTLSRGEIPNHTQNLLIGGPGSSGSTIGEEIAKKIQSSKGQLLYTSTNMSMSAGRIVEAVKSKLRHGDKVTFALGGLDTGEYESGVVTAAQLLIDSKDYKGKFSVKVMKEGIKSHMNALAFIDESFFIGGSARMTKAAMEGENVEMMLRKYDPKAVKQLTQIIATSWRDASKEEILTAAGLPVALLSAKLTRQTDIQLGTDSPFAGITPIMGMSQTRYTVQTTIPSAMRMSLRHQIYKQLVDSGKSPTNKEINEAYQQHIEKISAFGTYHYMYNSAVIAKGGVEAAADIRAVPAEIRIADLHALMLTPGEAEWHDSFVVRSASFLKEKIDNHPFIATVGGAVMGASIGGMIPSSLIAKSALVQAGGAIGLLGAMAAIKFFNVMPADMTKFQQIDRWDPFSSLVIHTIRHYEREEFERELLKNDEIFFRPKTGEFREGPIETNVKGLLSTVKNIALLSATYSLALRPATLFHSHVMQTTTEWMLSSSGKTSRNPLIRAGKGFTRGISRGVGAGIAALTIAGGWAYTLTTGKFFPSTVTDKLKGVYGYTPGTSIVAGTALAGAGAIGVGKAMHTVQQAYVGARSAVEQAGSKRTVIENASRWIGKLASPQMEYRSIKEIVRATFKGGFRAGGFAVYKSLGFSGALKVAAWATAAYGALGLTIWGDLAGAGNLTLDEQLAADKTFQSKLGPAFRAPITSYTAGIDRSQNFAVQILQYYRDQMIRAPLVRSYKAGMYDRLNVPVVKTSLGIIGAVAGSLTGFSLSTSRVFGAKSAIPLMAGFALGAIASYVGYNLNASIARLAGIDWEENKHLVGRETNWVELDRNFQSVATHMSQAMDLRNQALKLREIDPVKAQQLFERAQQLSLYAAEMSPYKTSSATLLTADVIQIGSPMLGVVFGGVLTKQQSKDSYERRFIMGAQGPFILQTGITIASPFAVKVSGSHRQLTYTPGTAWEAAMGIQAYASVGAAVVAPITFLTKRIGGRAVIPSKGVGGLGKALGAISFLNPISIGATIAMLPLKTYGLWHVALKDGVVGEPKFVTQGLNSLGRISKGGKAITAVAAAFIGAADLYLSTDPDANVYQKYERYTRVSKAIDGPIGALGTAGAVGWVTYKALQGFGKGPIGKASIGLAAAGLGLVAMNAMRDIFSGWVNMGWKTLSAYDMAYRPEDRGIKQMSEYTGSGSIMDLLNPEYLNQAIVVDKSPGRQNLPSGRNSISKFTGWFSTIKNAVYGDKPNQFMFIMSMGVAFRSDPELGTIPKAIFTQPVWAWMDMTHATSTAERKGGAGSKGITEKEMSEWVNAFNAQWGRRKDFLFPERSSPRISAGFYYSGDNSLSDAPPSILLAIQARRHIYEWALNANSYEVASYIGVTHRRLEHTKHSIFSREGSAYAIRPFEAHLGSLRGVLERHYKQLKSLSSKLSGSYEELDYSLSEVNDSSTKILIDRMQTHRKSLGSFMTAQFNKGDTDTWAKILGQGVIAVTTLSGAIAGWQYYRQHRGANRSLLSKLLGGVKGQVYLQSAMIAGAVDELDELNMNNGYWHEKAALSKVAYINNLKDRMPQIRSAAFKFDANTKVSLIFFNDQYYGLYDAKLSAKLGVSTGVAVSAADEGARGRFREITQRISTVIGADSNIKNLTKITGKLNVSSVIVDILDSSEVALSEIMDLKPSGMPLNEDLRPGTVDTAERHLKRVTDLRDRLLPRGSMEEIGDDVAKELDELTRSLRVFYKGVRKQIPNLFGLALATPRGYLYSGGIEVSRNPLKRLRSAWQEMFGELALKEREAAAALSTERPLLRGVARLGYDSTKESFPSFLKRLLTAGIVDEGFVVDHPAVLSKQYVTNKVKGAFVGAGSGLKFILGGALHLMQFGLVGVSSVSDFAAAFNPENPNRVEDAKEASKGFAGVAVITAMQLHGATEMPPMAVGMAKWAKNRTSYKWFAGGINKVVNSMGLAQLYAKVSTHFKVKIGWLLDTLKISKAEEGLAQVSRLKKFTGNSFAQMAAFAVVAAAESLEEMTRPWKEAKITGNGFRTTLGYGARGIYWAIKGIELGTRPIRWASDLYTNKAYSLAQSNNGFARFLGGFMEAAPIGVSIGGLLGGPWGALIGGLITGAVGGAIAAYKPLHNRLMSFLDKRIEYMASEAFVTLRGAEADLSLEKQGLKESKKTPGWWQWASMGARGAGIYIADYMLAGMANAQLKRTPAFSTSAFQGMSNSLNNNLLLQCSPIWHGNMYDYLKYQSDRQEQVREGAPGTALQWLTNSLTLGQYSTGLGYGDFIQHADLPGRFYGKVLGTNLTSIVGRRIGDDFKPDDPLAGAESLHVAMKSRAVLTDTWALGMAMKRRRGEDNKLQPEIKQGSNKGWWDRSVDWVKSSADTVFSGIKAVGSAIGNVISPPAYAGTLMPSASGSLMVQIAMKEVGTKEANWRDTDAGTNKVKYNTELGYGNVAWCANFVSWTMKEAGVPTEFRSASVPNMLTKFKTAGQFHRDLSKLKPGNIVFFDWDGSGPGHVAIVKSVGKNGQFESVDGNSDNMVKVRPRNFYSNQIIGFGVLGDANNPKGVSPATNKKTIDRAEPTKAVQSTTENTGWNKGLYSEMRQRGKANASEIEQAVTTASARFGLDKNLILATMKQESSFDPRARSHSDARGLMQIIPGWHRDAAKRDGIMTDNQFFEVTKNIQYGSRYLSSLMGQFSFNKTSSEDHIKIALTAYNQGEGTVGTAVREAARRFGKDKSQVTYNEMIQFVTASEGKNYAPAIMAHLNGTKVLPSSGTSAETTPGGAGEIKTESFMLAFDHNSNTSPAIDDPAHITSGADRMEGSRYAVISGGVGYTTTGKLKEYSELLSANHADVAPAIDFMHHGMDVALQGLS